ncbi:MAG TPA: hypothetical protein VH142_17650 [Polyangiaceae bacterium]|jgi:hypothetical protein|nr:hypothetical protein [Polyangiaceae bacterium]
MPTSFRAYAPASYDDGPLEPVPLRRISTRKHIPDEPARTRLGIGERFMDQAAGAPYSDAVFTRFDRTRPEPARLERSRASLEHIEWKAEDAPVRLPMRSSGWIALAAISLVVLVIAMCVSVAEAGGSATTQRLDLSGAVK